MLGEPFLEPPKSIKDFRASLVFPLGVLGELLRGPPNLFLGEDKVDNEISGDADRCLRVDVVATFVVVFAIVTSSSSKRNNGDGVRRRCPTSSSSAKSNSVGRFRVDVVSIMIVCEDNDDDSMMVGDDDDSCD